MNKPLKVNDHTWKKLMQIKLDGSFKSIDETISWLLSYYKVKDILIEKRKEHLNKIKKRRIWDYLKKEENKKK